VAESLAPATTAAAAARRYGLHRPAVCLAPAADRRASPAETNGGPRFVPVLLAADGPRLGPGVRPPPLAALAGSPGGLGSGGGSPRCSHGGGLRHPSSPARAEKRGSTPMASASRELT
jgi:hypothetical protein